MKKKSKIKLILIIAGVIWLVDKIMKVVVPQLKKASNLERDLKAHLEEKFGEAKRRITCIVFVTGMHIIIQYPAVFLEANPGMEEECRNFISEHYPDMVGFVKKIVFKPLKETMDSQE